MNDYNPYESPQSGAPPVVGKRGQLSRPLWLLLSSVGLAAFSLACFVGSALLATQDGPAWQPSALRFAAIGLLGVGVMLLAMAAIEQARLRDWR